MPRLSLRSVFVGTVMTAVTVALLFFVLRRWAPDNVKAFYRV